MRSPSFIAGQFIEPGGDTGTLTVRQSGVCPWVSPAGGATVSTTVSARRSLFNTLTADATHVP